MDGRTGEAQREVARGWLEGHEEGGRMETLTEHNMRWGREVYTVRGAYMVRGAGWGWVHACAHVRL